MITEYVNTHIIDNSPYKKEIYSRVDCWILGENKDYGFIRTRLVIATASIQIMTFATKDNILFDVNMN